jgi:hypothetical protein
MAEPNEKVVPAAATVEFVDLKDVEIAVFPCAARVKVKDEEKVVQFGLDTADALVATFQQFGGREVKPPLVLGHNVLMDAQGKPVKGATGAPALGWVTALKREGAKLLADIASVPRKVKDLIDKGAYRRISGSWWLDGAEANLAAAAGKPVLRHVGLLGADTPALKTLKDVTDLFAGGDVPQAAFADADSAGVAEFQDAGPAAADQPATLKEAIQERAAEAGAETPLSIAIKAMRERLWVIDDTTRTDADKAAALKDLEAELAKFLAAYQPVAGAPASPVAAAAAAMSDPPSPAASPPASADLVRQSPSDGGKSAAATPIPAPPKPAEAAVSAAKAGSVEMTDAVRQTVEVFITRATAEGRLLPKHHPAIRASAAAVFAHGGEEAVAAFCDDEDSRRTAKVIQLGESAPAVAGAMAGEPAGASAKAGAVEMSDADPAIVAAAEADFDRYGFSRSLGITKDQYVRAKTKRA